MFTSAIEQLCTLNVIQTYHLRFKQQQDERYYIKPGFWCYPHSPGVSIVVLYSNQDTLDDVDFRMTEIEMHFFLKHIIKYHDWSDNIIHHLWRFYFHNDD